MEDFILKYDKEVAMKTGALSYKLFIFMLWIASFIVLISSALFELIGFYQGMSSIILNKYVAKIIYFSMFILFIWLCSSPIWYPAHIAENVIWVKKNNKFYRITNKKENFLDKDNKLENSEILSEVIANLPNTNKNAIIEEFSNINILKKTNKYVIIELKGKDKIKKYKIYNIYDNFEKLINCK